MKADEVDWRAIAIALAVKYGGREGVALVGAATQQFARERVQVELERDGDAVRMVWRAPSLTGGA